MKVEQKKGFILRIINILNIRRTRKRHEICTTNNEECGLIEFDTHIIAWRQEIQDERVSNITKDLT